MKNVIAAIFTLMLCFCAPLSSAAEATGIIEEFKICGSGATGDHKWKRTIQFKVSGQWFGIYADFDSTVARDHDNDISTSIIMMALSQNRPISVKATDTWHSNYFTKCGVTSGAVFNDNAGDYIAIVN